MQTQLLEFHNKNDQTLRGILNLPKASVKHLVICLHGFERCSSTEKKFKRLADELLKKNIACLRLDFSGSGLSNGEFRDTTIERQAGEFAQAFQKLKDELGAVKISVAAHSLGACVLAKRNASLKEKIHKIVLLAPALNQKELLRYWFVVSQMKKAAFNQEITWQNYEQFLNEKDFIADCQRTDKTVKANYISADYFLENQQYDYSQEFEGWQDKILYIHGDQDEAVPLESLNVEFRNKIIVRGGDHDLEKPWMIEQWLDKAVGFLEK
jgi:uncharacterized protein